MRTYGFMPNPCAPGLEIETGQEASEPLHPGSATPFGVPKPPRVGKRLCPFRHHPRQGSTPCIAPREPSLETGQGGASAPPPGPPRPAPCRAGPAPKEPSPFGSPRRFSYRQTTGDKLRQTSLRTSRPLDLALAYDGMLSGGGRNGRGDLLAQPQIRWPGDPCAGHGIGTCAVHHAPACRLRDHRPPDARSHGACHVLDGVDSG